MTQKMDLDTCPVYLREYLQYMRTVKGRSQTTVFGYYTDLRMFLRFVHCVYVMDADPTDDETFYRANIQNVPLSVLESLTLASIYDFLNFMAEHRQNEAKTRSRKVSAVRGLYEYLTVRAGLLSHNPLEHLEVPKLKKALPRYLTLSQGKTLLDALDSTSPFYLRDYCMLVLFLNCGMRLSELVGINVNDVRQEVLSDMNLSGQQRSVFTLRLVGKGDKERIVYLNDACIAALEAYLQIRPQPLKNAHKQALFLSKRLTRITPRRVEQIVEEALNRAGLGGRGYSPHKLRHTAATLMYQHGHVDVRILQAILGHANLGTTEIYTHLADAQMEEAAHRSPLANVQPKPSQEQRDPIQDAVTTQRKKH